MKENQIEEAVMLRKELINLLAALDPLIVGNTECRGEEIFVRDGELRLSVEIPPQKTCEDVPYPELHIVATIGDERFVVCSLENAPKPAKFVALEWIKAAAPPIFSYLLGRPVLGSREFFGHEPWGVARRHGFVGPLMGFNVESIDSVQKPDPFRKEPPKKIVAMPNFSEEPLFFNAAELADDKNIHFAKASLNNFSHQWKRILTLDAHTICMPSSPWPPKLLKTPLSVSPLPDTTMTLACFAVFEAVKDYQPQTEEEHADEAIFQTLEFYAKGEETDFSLATLLRAGIAEKFAADICCMFPLALGRRVIWDVFGPDVQLSETCTMICRDGSIFHHLPLEDNLVYSRTLLLVEGLKFLEKYSLVLEGFLNISQELMLIDQATKAGSNPGDLVFSEPLAFEAGTDDETWEKAFAKLCRDESYLSQFDSFHVGDDSLPPLESFQGMVQQEHAKGETSITFYPAMETSLTNHSVIGQPLQEEGFVGATFDSLVNDAMIPADISEAFALPHEICDRNLTPPKSTKKKRWWQFWKR